MDMSQQIIIISKAIRFVSLPWPLHFPSAATARVMVFILYFRGSATAKSAMSTAQYSGANPMVMVNCTFSPEESHFPAMSSCWKTSHNHFQLQIFQATAEQFAATAVTH